MRAKETGRKRESQCEKETVCIETIEEKKKTSTPINCISTINLSVY